MASRNVTVGSVHILGGRGGACMRVVWWSSVGNGVYVDHSEREDGLADELAKHLLFAASNSSREIELATVDNRTRII